VRVTWRRSLAFASIVVLAACGPRVDFETDSTHAVPVGAFALPDSAALRAATAALGQFLDASREGSLQRAVLERLIACPGETSRAAGPMLAAFELLPPATRADTIVGRAVVTTVADQDVDRIHPGYFVARMRIRRDTLEWDVLRAESGDWIVCNGLRFGLTAPDSLITWRPTGASAEAARAVADSIAAQR
jgi:hypothetical protein